MKKAPQDISNYDEEHKLRKQYEEYLIQQPKSVYCPSDLKELFKKNSEQIFQEKVKSNSKNRFLERNDNLKEQIISKKNGENNRKENKEDWKDIHPDFTPELQKE